MCLLLALSVAPVRAADSSTTIAAPAETTGTNDTLRALLALQEELHETQLAIEKNRLEAERSRLEAQNANLQGSVAMSNRLAAIEQSVLAQHASEVDALRSTNRFLLAVIGIFAAIGFVAALFTAYFQLRAVNRLTDISTAISAGRTLGLPPAATAGLSENAAAALANGSVEQANSRLIGLVQHLEKRVIELEQTTALPLKESSNGHGEPQGHPELALDSTPSEKTAQIGRLLERGQSLLSEQPEDAVRAFNEVLAIQPNHAEALVKKGTALEKMRQPQEALECYDRAIAADSSLTIAYLHKGGLCSRLEKYGEAMECYERALHTQEKKRAA
ncbi:MAG TPA: tetratricopeptide repeat protein [Candidatus Polarisedimenticolia bacterium]|nr:tetratricopeptide repeat protein [Candidatus Polarisedimenticolia bacterium]